MIARQYSEFKPSRIEWTGLVPRHWDESRLADIAIVKARLGWKGLKAAEYVEDGFGFLATPNIKSNEIDFENINFITKERFEESPEIILREGDVLLAKDGSTLGISNVVRRLPFPATVNGSIAVVRPKSRIVPSFLNYYFKSKIFQSEIERMKGGMGVPHLFQSDLRKFLILIPPLIEQDAISIFLDNEIAKIDALITKQTEFRSLLEERHHAVITEAVTKGPDPSVPTKETGISAVPLIPRHWVVKRLKHVSPRITVGIVVNPSTFVSDEGAPFYFGADVTEDGLSDQPSRRISTEGNAHNAKSVLRTGDLVMVRVGYPGLTAVVGPKQDGANCASLVIIRRAPQFDSEWLCYALNSQIGKAQIDLVKYGAAQEQFNVAHAAEFLVPVPPLDEQRHIAELISIEQRGVRGLRAIALSLIVRLQERRSALITAAVTGQIDVTQAAPAKVAA
jgi:type I restriction enzyme S subunit